eukprot:15055300-Alexandrium_andersonii.AAC.1
MSASLVGSEMCIRDRRQQVRHAAVVQVALLAEALRVGMRPRLVSCVAPVSYTHLTLPTICSV